MLEQSEAQRGLASEIRHRAAVQQQQGTIEVVSVSRQQVHAPPSVSTEPLPSVNPGFSQPGDHRQVGRRIHLMPVARVTDPLNEQTEVKLRAVRSPRDAGLHITSGREVSIRAPLRSAEGPYETSEIQLVVGSGSDPGITRRNRPNEDSILTIYGPCSGPDRSLAVGLFVVADGMGGHASGQDASRLAIKVLSDVVVPAVQPNVGSEGVLEKLLADGVCSANLAIYERNQQQSTFMGTTMTAALIVGMTAYIVNVGDSRTYLYRQSDGLLQITRDHSVVARLVEEKAIQVDEIYTHPRRNEIYRCLGERASVEVDAFTVPLQIGDSLLLCSDGLWEMVRDPHMEGILQRTDAVPAQASHLLIQAALNGGGKDNVSAIVAQVAALSTKS